MTRAGRRPRGVFARIWFGYMALALTVVLLTGGICFHIVSRNNVITNLRDMQEKTEVIASLLSMPGGRARTLSTPKFREIQRLTNTRILYVDADMTVHYLAASTDADIDSVYLAETEFSVQRGGIADALDRELIESILAGETLSEVRRLEFLRTSIALCGAPVTDLAGDDPSAIVGAVLLYRPLDDVSDAARVIALLFSLAGCAALLFALAASWMLSNRIAKPILRLNAAAKRIAEGSYEPIENIQSASELAELNETLSSLGRRLQTVICSLSDEKSKLTQILAGIGEGIIAVDSAGNVTHHNAASLELLETQSWQLNGALSRQGDLKSLLEQATRTQTRFETGWARSDGRQIQANIYTVNDDAGDKPVGAVALMRDVSESVRLEQMRRDYVANISHELRTPLTGIRGMAEPLLDGVIDTEDERHACYKVIYQETLRLEKLIADMLDMSRLQDGRTIIELGPVDLTNIMRAAEERVRQRALSAGIRLILQTDDAPLVCMGDEDRVLQLLIIFLDNAFGFTPANGSITLFGRQEGDGVVFGVRDTGSGIDPKDLPYIWERFFKGDRSRMRTTGTGLGLAIAKRITELMDGEIGVQTELGRGSEFFVRLKSM